MRSDEISLHLYAGKCSKGFQTQHYMCTDGKKFKNSKASKCFLCFKNLSHKRPILGREDYVSIILFFYHINLTSKFK